MTPVRLSRTVPSLTPQALLSTVASRRQVHAAFQFFHLQEAVFRDWHERLVQIPAPPFAEAARAAELAALFGSEALKLTEIRTDAEGNVLATSPGSNREAPLLAVCAHLDTVFPSHTPLELKREGDRILVPGASDNGAGLAAMLALAAGLRSARIEPPCDILFVGTVGEEGDGNLRGMRALFASQLGRRIGSAIVLDGAGSATAVTQALASRRYTVEINGPGGHSWSDSARPNPITAMAQAIAAFQQEPLPHDPATTVNFATIQGGTSINAIPDRVTCKVDIRSFSGDEIVRQEVRLYRAVEDAVLSSPSFGKQGGKHRLRHTITRTGERPSGALAQDSSLAQMLRVVDRHLQITTRTRVASTDANIPLALGIPATTLGGGGTGGDAHTPEEWFDPTGRETALRRILLLVLTVAETLAAAPPEDPLPEAPPQP